MIKYKTKCGLNVIFIPKKGFVKSYVGLGCSFGGANLEFTIDSKNYKSPSGVAHFIEHKLFQMPDGTDAFNTFNEMNTNANAYTASDKTLYYFTTTESIYEPLKLLLDMYFTPCFYEKDIEKEKEIIISEINMYEDRSDNRFNKKILESLYPLDSYSFPVGGLEEDVRNTKVDDLLTAYNAFYTPENSQLVVVSDLIAEELFDFIEDVLSKYQFKDIKAEKIPTVKSDKIGNDFIHYDDVNQNECVLGIRFAASTDNSLFCNFIIGIFDCLFTSSAIFYKELRKNKAFISDIDYVVVTEKYSAYALISAPTNKPDLFAKMIIDKLKNLNPNDLDEEILDYYLRHLKSRYIILEDSIEGLGDEVIGLALEGSDYFKEREEVLKLGINDFNSIIKYINSAQYLKAICKKNTNKH